MSLKSEIDKCDFLNNYQKDKVKDLIDKIQDNEETITGVCEVCGSSLYNGLHRQLCVSRYALNEKQYEHFINTMCSREPMTEEQKNAHALLKELVKERNTK